VPSVRNLSSAAPSELPSYSALARGFCSAVETAPRYLPGGLGGVEDMCRVTAAPVPLTSSDLALSRGSDERGMTMPDSPSVGSTNAPMTGDV